MTQTAKNQINERKCTRNLYSYRNSWRKKIYLNQDLLKCGKSSISFLNSLTCMYYTSLLESRPLALPPPTHLSRISNS